MFQLKHLTKTFRTGDIETTALDRIDLDIEAGEYLAITGPSGCGKSTLLGILGLLDAPSGGEYWFDGHNVAGWTEKQLNTLRRGRIGFVFQSFNLIDDLSVAENIGLALEYGALKIELQHHSENACKSGVHADWKVEREHLAVFQ